MILDYLASGSQDTPLVRMSGFSSDNVRLLHTAIGQLASRDVRQLRLTDLPFIRSELVFDLYVATRSSGTSASPPHLQCYLTAASWDGVAGLLEPFIELPTGGYQWLEYEGEVAWLISSNGKW